MNCFFCIVNTGLETSKKERTFVFNKSTFFLAAGEGFEPSQTESESVVLPLHNPASDLDYYNKYFVFVKVFFCG